MPATNEPYLHDGGAAGYPSHSRAIGSSPDAASGAVRYRLASMGDALAIDAQGLQKRFGSLRAVDGLDLQVPVGACYAFLGPNGAGKSTSISLLTGLFPPDAGQARILGLDLIRETLAIKQRIGVVPEELALFERMSGYDYLVFCGRMYGLSADQARERSRELLALTELEPRARALVADYSKGMRRRLAIGASLIHRPDLVFLDEPFEGIDIIAGAVIRALLRDLREAGVTVFITTHVLEIADRLATHAGVLLAGRVVASGQVGELRKRYDTATLEGVFQACAGAPRAAKTSLSWYR
jgi:ABC-2 type transport system ATP-binding protein